MAQHRTTAFVNVSLTPDAREALRRLTDAASAAIGRHLTMSDTIIYAEQLMTSKGAIAQLETLRGRDQT
jgi:predicted glycoside hydrolase/deacetylase ChbG (UPF0249 family)